MQAMGGNSSLRIDFETEAGKKNATPHPVEFEFIKSTIKAEQNQNESKVITGRRDQAEPYRGFIDVAGDIETPLDLVQTGYLLKWAFGAPTTTEVAEKAGTYQHVFKLGAPSLSSTVEQAYKDIGVYAQYSGCKVSKMSFSFGGDNELSVQLSVMGIREYIEDTPMSDTPKIVGYNKVNFDNAFLKDGGEAVAIATEAKIDLDFGLDGDSYCIGGGGFRKWINDATVKISGSMKSIFESKEIIERAANGTKTSIEIPLIKGDQSMSILLPEVMFKRNTPGIDGPKGILAEMEFMAFYNSNNNNTSIVITIINDVESYQ